MDALKERDGELARRLVEEHIENAESALLAAFEDSEEKEEDL
jgi:DNA-binding GntR family transcriptional regulator